CATARSPGSASRASSPTRATRWRRLPSPRSSPRSGRRPPRSEPSRASPTRPCRPQSSRAASSPTAGAPTAGGWPPPATWSRVSGTARLPSRGPGRAVAWAARGLRTPAREALLAEAVPPEYLGRAFGIERAGDSLGAIAGPLVAAALLSTIGYRHLFWISFFPALAAALSVRFLAREVPRAR